eukprot:Phypoly_transcript_04906.p1 GENE.Phypoly_transcript_04906~~Phypoly_transcript_04906.p1  ORF type:complete len:624 (+),score=102.78 Phypoly_transcript_04906:62-1873(+)
MDTLPDELVMYLYRFMDVKGVLTMCCVCKQWMEIALDDTLWRERAALPCSPTRLSTSQLDTEPGKWFQLYRELGGVFVPTRMLNLLQEAFDASSTDNQQDLSNTLSKDELFWSSLGSADKESSEYVVYKLVQPLCIVQYVDIFAYKALYQTGMPIYAPQYIRVSVGFSPNIKNMHYTSEPFKMQNIDSLQQLVLDQPQFGGFVRLDLIGRQQTQPGDDLWYTVLRYVRVGGVPSGALMDKVYLTNALLRFAFENPSFAKNIDNDGSVDVFEQTKSKLKQGISASLQVEMRKIDETARIAKMIEEGNIPNAAKTAVLNSQELDLRNEEILKMFKKVGGLKSYFSVCLISRTPLNASESLALAELATQTSDFALFDSFLRSERIQPSEELGDYLVQTNNLNLAVYVYIRAHIPDKVNDTLVKLGQYAKIINYATITMHRLDFSSMLARFNELHPKHLTLEFALALAIPHHHGNPLLAHDTIREILKIPPSTDLVDYLTEALSNLQATLLGNLSQDQQLLIDPDDLTDDEDDDEDDGVTNTENWQNNNSYHSNSNNKNNNTNNNNNNDSDNNDNNNNNKNDSDDSNNNNNNNSKTKDNKNNDKNNK